MALCPNIASLYISCASLKAKDSAVGPRRTPPVMSIRHLYYEQVGWQKENKTKQEVDKIMQNDLARPWSSVVSRLYLPILA